MKALELKNLVIVLSEDTAFLAHKAHLVGVLQDYSDLDEDVLKAFHTVAGVISALEELDFAVFSATSNTKYLPSSWRRALEKGDPKCEH